MADPNSFREFRNNEPSPRIRGGTERPSKRVDLQRFPAIQRRQELNSILLQRSCGIERTPSRIFEQEDVKLLLQIARERDPNENSAIRKQAIHALGQFKDLAVAELMWDIVLSDMEAEELQVNALTALAQITPTIARTLLHTLLSHESAVIRQSVVYTLAAIGNNTTLNLLTALLKRERNVGVREHTITTIRLIGERLGVSVSPPREPQPSQEERVPYKEQE